MSCKFAEFDCLFSNSYSLHHKILYATSKFHTILYMYCNGMKSSGRVLIMTLVHSVIVTIVVFV